MKPNAFIFSAYDWECSKKDWTRTVLVLQHFHAELSKKYNKEGGTGVVNGLLQQSPQKRPCSIA